MKKLVLALAVAVGMATVAACLGTSTTMAPPADETSTEATVAVPLTTSGPDKSYTAGESAQSAKKGS